LLGEVVAPILLRVEATKVAVVAVVVVVIPPLLVEDVVFLPAHIAKSLVILLSVVGPNQEIIHLPLRVLPDRQRLQFIRVTTTMHLLVQDRLFTYQMQIIQS
jgi:hypothetical protein